MSNIFCSSIGKKVIMSLSGLFLIVFLVVHLTINAFLLVGDGELFNLAAHFMSTNPIMHMLEPILGLGFIIHIIYSIIITIQNMRARPVKYAVSNQQDNSTWASRNMFILGGLIGIFLVIHIINFFYKVKFGELTPIVIDGVSMDDTYLLVSSLFKMPLYSIMYVFGAAFLGLHLYHAFQSAFQTLGVNNQIWRKRWNAIGLIYTLIVAGGFAIIPAYFLITEFL